MALISPSFFLYAHAPSLSPPSVSLRMDGVGALARGARGGGGRRRQGRLLVFDVSDVRKEAR